MSLYFIALLALVQGLTEFLPVSSSAHLILAHTLIDGQGRSDPWGRELMLDVAVHVGTLASVLVYFRKDVWAILRGFVRAAITRQGNDGFKTGLMVAAASVPVILAGTVLSVIEPGWLRSVPVIGWTTLLFGILLWAADRFFPEVKMLETHLTFKNALVIGAAQMLALIPGVSRSGITMTAGRFLGYRRVDAARFSLLLSMVAISGAGCLQGWRVIDSGSFVLGADVCAAAVLAFLSGWGAIALMMRWLARAGFMPFVLYRVALGFGLLGLYYAGLLDDVVRVLT